MANSKNQHLKLSSLGLRHIANWEGFRSKSYKCPANVWTIGFGHTGKAAAPGNSITRQEAERLLARDVSRFEDAVKAAVNVPLTQHQFDALVSFTFNVGTGALQRSTLLRKLNQGRYDAVPGQLLRWVYGGGRKLPGLRNRRISEIELWRKA